MRKQLIGGVYNIAISEKFPEISWKIFLVAVLFSKAVSLDSANLLKKEFISDIFPDNWSKPFRTQI